MPEYLAPGVYVEETSFRAKSIEGVGTSTTAFLGPTRKGPLASTGDAAGPPVPPELLTSFGDFVRTYGGLADLGLSPQASTNYLAHAVLNFFNEGGSRLYVARVASGATAAGRAIVGDLTNPADNNRIFVRARFPGQSGNGRVTFREILTPVTADSLDGLPDDTLLRARGTVASEPARISGGTAERMSVANGAVLRLLVNNTPRTVTFLGEPTEATPNAALQPTTTLNDSNRTLNVTIDTVAQSVQVPAGDYTPAQLALAVNERLQGGYARLSPTNELIIGTDRRGFDGRVRVAQNDAFGYTEEENPTPVFEGARNNLPDLASFTAADLDRVLEDQNAGVTAARVGGRLSIATRDLGDTRTLEVSDATAAGAGPVSAHTGLGLDLPGAGDPPARGSNVRLFRRQGNDWRDPANNALPIPADRRDVVGQRVTLLVTTVDGDDETDEYDDVRLVSSEPRYLGRLLGIAGTTRADHLQRLYGFDIGSAVDSAALHAALFPAGSDGDINQGLIATHPIDGGGNGGEPGVGVATVEGSYAAAFEQLRGLEDVSIVAAPGHSAYDTRTYRDVQNALLQHVRLARAYRIAVLDTPPNLLPGEARQHRAQIDSTYAALYYPWVTVVNPLSRPGRENIPREINLPPSGFICGIYARNDVEQTVAKAPANEVVRGALRFESDVNFAQNQLLNPIGVNCLRYFPGRGFRVWGARTAGSDPEIKYVNVRRYLLYLEASIDRGTQWAVFENNGPRLWANITETVTSFLYNEWVSGNLLGTTPKEAFFVRCDRTTMTQNNLDNGQLICLVGVALLKPAEFVIFRIGQKTADARS
jgi:phage tail sheath protein FI